jgi:serine/threonine protein phosphatase PrpC
MNGVGTCPVCGEPTAEGARYCEACGGALTPGAAAAAPVTVSGEPPARPCVDCGAPPEQIAADRYCQVCGRKQPAPHDHEELVLPGVVAVTDRGRVHHRNEDAFACGVADGIVVVMVSDGVSSTADSDRAAITATAAARDHALGRLVAGDDLADAVRGATARAQEAAAAIGTSTGDDSASCTAVYFAARRVDRLTWRGAVAWLGDSRAYLFRSDLVRGEVLEQLTVDHSWATEQIAAGMSPVDALADPRGHSITRWLGADAVDAEPSVREIDLVAGDVVLVVSDGLWNHVPDEASFHALLADRGHGDTLDSVRALVDFANERGGHDNITVAVATF